MKVINYWEHFLTTGSVSEYLNYLGERRQNEPAARSGAGAGKGEGTGQRYRDDIESGTHRGI